MPTRRSLLVLFFGLTLGSPLLAGPPWISIELPPNPFDPATRGALLLVRTFHYRNDGEEPVTGRAVGIVDGERRRATLRFDATPRAGVVALRNSWGERGEWTLVITATQPGDHGGAAEAMVKVSAGRVIGVEVATGESRFRELPVMPRRFTDAEIEASLKGRGLP